MPPRKRYHQDFGHGYDGYHGHPEQGWQYQQQFGGYSHYGEHYYEPEQTTTEPFDQIKTSTHVPHFFLFLREGKKFKLTFQVQN